MVRLKKIPRRLKEIKDFVDEYIDFSEEPIEGLVPVGDTGLYRTPDEPADPEDCDRYPDSPFCGGNPFTLTPVGLEPKIIIGDCDIGVTLSPVLGFVKLPPVSLVYRKPECRVKPKPLTRREISFSTTCYPIDCYHGDVTIGYSSTVWERDPEIIADFDSAIPSDIPFNDDGNGNTQLWFITGHFTIKDYQEIQTCFTRNQEAVWITGTIDPETHNPVFSYESNRYNLDNGYITKPLYKISHSGYSGAYDAYSVANINWWFDDFKIEYITCSLDKPPPPPKEICCMPQCCPPPDDALLKLLLKKVNKLSEIVGVDRFPAEFPKRLTYPNAKGSEKVKDLVELLGFQIKQVDRAVGYLPQKIKVADTNPGLAGNQSVEVEIHSFADFCKEILQYVIDTEGDGDVTNNMLVRALYELGFIHQGVVQGNAMLDATVDHLDFKHKWKKIRVPFAFDPYAGQKGKVGQGFDKQKNSADNKTEEAVEELLPKLLNNTEVDIRILVNDEKKSLNDLLQDIKRDTAMAAAAVAEESTPKRLEQLVAAAQLMLQVQSAIDRRNMRQALIAGNLKTRKIKR